MSSLLESIEDAPGAILWITTKSEPAREGWQRLLVTTLDHDDGVDPKRLGDLRSAATAFLERHGDGLILLDCIEALTLHNGVERVARMVQDLHDEIATRGAVLVVLVDPHSTNPRLVAWLERELDELPHPPLQWVTPETPFA